MDINSLIIEQYREIINDIVPNFLKRYSGNYVVIGGKAYEYYFKSIITDDWDIVIDTDPKKFIEELKKYMVEQHDILLANLIESVAVIKDQKLYQLGYGPYKSDDNFFIDIKREGTLREYGSLLLENINIASLNYLYHDGLETYKDRIENYESIDRMFTDEDVIREKIKYLRYTIQSNIPRHYKFIKHFYIDILPKSFNQSNEMIQQLASNLKRFLSVYRSNILTIDIDSELKEEYETLDKLQKYSDESNIKNLKHRLLHSLVLTLDKFYLEKDLLKKRKKHISEYYDFLKTQGETKFTIKSKYLKSFRRHKLFNLMIEKSSVSHFSDKFKNYIKRTCRHGLFHIDLGDIQLDIQCNKRRNSTGHLKTFYLGIKKLSKKLSKKHK
jgi:hypothetical protein